MTRIGLLSDTHSYLDEKMLHHFAQVDEIWHAGDVGNKEVCEKLQNLKPVKGVYGNIDDASIQQFFPRVLQFTCEEVRVLITHIGGYPPKYNAHSLPLIQSYRPNLFITGHSHILKIMYDHQLQVLHMNPGAAGTHGWHQKRTIVRFNIHGNNIQDCEVIELGPRSANQ
jgi:putative phosphoesterase